MSWPFEPETVDRVWLGQRAVVWLAEVILTVCGIHLPGLPLPLYLSGNQDSPRKGTIELEIEEEHLKKKKIWYHEAILIAIIDIEILSI